MPSYLCDYRGAEGEIGYEMAVHDVDVDPRGVVFHEVGACISKCGEVGTEDGGRDYSRRRHGDVVVGGLWGRVSAQGGKLKHEDSWSQFYVVVRGTSLKIDRTLQRDGFLHHRGGDFGVGRLDRGT